MTSIRAAASVEDAMLVLPIRNEARTFMTRYQDLISEDQQHAWWSSQDGKSLYIVEDHEAIAYGLIVPHRDPTFAMLSGAVRSEYRGAGYGSLIFSFMIGMCRIRNVTPWLEVFAHNHKAIQLYLQLGFVDTGSDGEMIRTMVLR